MRAPGNVPIMYAMHKISTFYMLSAVMSTYTQQYANWLEPFFIKA